MKTQLVQIALLATLTFSTLAWAQILTKDEAREHEARVQRAYDEVNIGDSKAHVLEVAGQPGNITPATEADGEMWIYFSGHPMDVSLLFKDGKVIDKVQRFINIKGSEVTEPSRFCLISIAESDHFKLQCRHPREGGDPWTSND